MAIVNGDNSLFFASGLDNSGLLKGTVQAEGMISSMAGNIAKINPFAALGVGAIAAFGIVASESHKMVKEFDKAMKEVKTISQAAQNDYEGISNLVFDLSKISPDQPKELAEAYYQVVSAGYDGAEGLNVLATASQAAVAGVTDTKTAVDGLTTILNAYKLSASETENISDALFNTVKLGKTTMEELSASISQVAPIAAASNIPLNEILSNIATLTKQGVPTAQAMTQIRSAIVGLSEAGKLDGAKTLQENMQALYNEMEGNQTKIQKEVGTVEALQAILATSGKNALSATKDLKSYNTIAGATAIATKTMLEENGNQWQIFENRIKAKTKGIGDSVLAMSTGIAKSLNSVLEPTENVTQALDDERKSINRLHAEYLSAEGTMMDRKNILEDISRIMPSVVSGVQKWSDSEEQLKKNIDALSLEEHKALIDFLTKRYPDLTKEIKTQADVYKVLSSALNNESLSDRKELLIDLNKLNPSVISSIQNESDAYKILTENLSKYNSEIAKRRIFAEKQGEIDKRDKSIQDLYYEQNKLEKEALLSISSFIDSGSLNDTKIEDEVKNILSDSRISLGDKISEIGSIVDEYNKELLGFVKNVNYGDGDRPIYSKSEQERASVKTISFNNETLNRVREVNREIKSLEALNEKASKSLSDEIFKNEDNEKKSANVIARINKQTTLEKLNQFDKYKTESIKKSLELRKGVVSQLEKIKEANNTVSGRDFVSSFLESDNKEIASVAKEKYDSINEALKGLNKKELDNQKTQLDAFKKTLADKKEAYENYKNLLTNGYNEEAKEYKSNLDLQYKDYQEYLNNRLKTAKTTTEKINLLSAGADPNPIISAVGVNLKAKGVIEPTQKPIEAFSINNLNQFNTGLKGTLAFLNEIRDDKKGVFNIGSTIKIFNQISKVKNSDLSDKAEVLKVLGEDLNQSIVGGLEDASGALNEASSLFSKFGDDATADLLNQATGVATGVARIASGDIVGGALATLNAGLSVEVISDTAKFEEAIEEFKKSAIKISNDITNFVGTDQANSTYSLIENLRDQQEQIKLAQEAEEQARKEVKFLGVKLGDKGSGSGTDASKLEELADQADETKQKIIELTEEYNELITSTTRDTLGDAILQGLKDGKRGIQDFADTFDEILTDSLLETFKREKLTEASRAFLEKFGELSDSDVGYLATQRNVIESIEQERDAYFEELVAFNKEASKNKNKDNKSIQDELQRMKDIYYNEFPERIKEAQDIYDNINKGVGENDLTADEIAELREVFNDTVGQASSEFEALQEFLEQAGVDTSSLNGDIEQAGLSGAIRRELTEETGSELTGLFRGGYDLAKQHFALATQELGVSQNILQESIASSAYLNQIQINTANTAINTANIILELREIKANTQGSSTTSRDTGYGL